MGPPTEQLIRDYLNRLSVAARGQLGPDDRRALVSRTRDFIERNAGLSGPPTALEVARLLSGLGDPARLVSQERQRLAGLRGEELKPASRRPPGPDAARRSWQSSRCELALARPGGQPCGPSADVARSPVRPLPRAGAAPMAPTAAASPPARLLLTPTGRPH